MRHRWLGGVVALLLIAAAPVPAQSERCPAVVQAALASVDSLCRDLSRNQACYGNLTLTAEPRSGAASFVFSQPGDRVNVVDVQRLSLSPLDSAAETWGVALLKLQANLPETLPGQNVTMLLFGNVELQAASEPISAALTATTAVIVYEQPTDRSRIVAGLIVGQSAAADGQTADGAWLRLRLSGKHSGWALADQLAGDGSALPVVDPASAEAPRVWQPLQAFYFRTGFQDAPCAEAPDSGMLIQVPGSAGAVLLRINDVDVMLGSTAYFQAQPDGDMTISVLDGAAVVSAGGVTRAAPAGTQIRVPLDSKLKPAAPPRPVESYDVTRLAALPVRRLDQPVAVAPALLPEQIESLDTPTAGEWSQTSTGLSVCADGFTREIVYDDMIIIADVQPADFLIINSQNQQPYDQVRLNRTAAGRYTSKVYDEQGRPFWFYEYFVAAPDRIIGTVSAFYYDPDCRDDLQRTIKRVRPAVPPPPADPTTPPGSG